MADDAPGPRTSSRAARLAKLGEFAMNSERERDVHAVSLCGELDLAIADGLTFLDSTGIRLLWNAHLRSRADSNRLTLLRGPAAVQRALELTGLDDRLPFAD